MKVADIPVFVDVARDQLLRWAVAVQEALPSRRPVPGDGRQRCGRRVGRAGFQPACQRLVLGFGQRWQAEGHAAFAGACGRNRRRSRRAHANLLAVQREVEIGVGQLRRCSVPGAVCFSASMRYMTPPSRLASGVCSRSLSTGKKPFCRQPAIGQGIEAEAGRLVGDQPHAGIDWFRIGTAGQPGVAGQVELAGRVVTGVAGDAALVEQRTHFPPVVRGTADRGGRMIEARRVGRAETVVELQGADDGGATGDEGQKKRGAAGA